MSELYEETTIGNSSLPTTTPNLVKSQLELCLIRDCLHKCMLISHFSHLNLIFMRKRDREINMEINP